MMRGKSGARCLLRIGPTNDGVSVKTESIEQAMFLIELERGEKAPLLSQIVDKIAL